MTYYISGPKKRNLDSLIDVEGFSSVPGGKPVCFKRDRTGLPFNPSEVEAEPLNLKPSGGLAYNALDQLGIKLDEPSGLTLSENGLRSREHSLLRGSDCLLADDYNFTQNAFVKVFEFELTSSSDIYTIKIDTLVSLEILTNINPYLVTEYKISINYSGGAAPTPIFYESNQELAADFTSNLSIPMFFFVDIYGLFGTPTVSLELRVFSPGSDSIKLRDLDNKARTLCSYQSIS